MLEDFKHERTSVRILITLGIIALGIHLLGIFWGFLQNFSDVIVILIFSWVLSFALEPVVNFIGRWLRTSRVWSALVAYVLLAVLLGLVIYLYLPDIESQVAKLVITLPHKLNGMPAFITKWGDTVSSSLQDVFSFLPSIASILFNSFVVLLISFYFIVDKARIQEELYELTPRSWHKNMKFIQTTIDTTFASFLQIQLLFAIISGITTWIVLALLGIDFAASSGLFAGILTFVPIIGPILALIPPLIAAFVVDPNRAIIVLAILFVIQQIEFNIISPRLMGHAFKLHPVVVLLSFLVGMKIAGFVGAIFAVPVIGIIVVLIREFGHYFLGSRK